MPEAREQKQARKVTKIIMVFLMTPARLNVVNSFPNNAVLVVQVI